MTDEQRIKHPEFAKRLREALDTLPARMASTPGDGTKPPRMAVPTISAAARAVGVSPQVFRLWLEGETKPRSAALDRLAAFLGHTPEFLLFGTPSLAPSAPQRQLWMVMLDTDELNLVNEYRLSTELGKRHMQLSALGTDKLPPDQLPTDPVPLRATSD